ncbi:MAG: zinc ribbon domain-containing protein [Planctomycetes bacterium]|nr:zinc ribbon domain-containing protein [Planctomycetota bacterium]
MPTYDYHCGACKKEFEQFQSMKDKPLRKCPLCGKNALERLIGTGAAVLFKGSGFYQTDYRSESYKQAASADKPADVKTDTKTESKTETKAEAKAETKPASEAKPAKPEQKPAKSDGSKKVKAK